MTLNEPCKGFIRDWLFSEADNSAIGASEQENRVILALSATYGDSGLFEGNAGALVELAVEWLLLRPSDGMQQNRLDALFSRPQMFSEVRPNNIPYACDRCGVLVDAAYRDTHVAYHGGPITVSFTPVSPEDPFRVCSLCGALVAAGQPGTGHLHAEFHSI